METTTIQGPWRVRVTKVHLTQVGLCSGVGKLTDGRKVQFVGDSRALSNIAKALRTKKSIPAWIEAWQITDVQTPRIRRGHCNLYPHTKG